MIHIPLLLGSLERNEPKTISSFSKLLRKTGQVVCSHWCSFYTKAWPILTANVLKSDNRPLFVATKSKLFAAGWSRCSSTWSKRRSGCSQLFCHQVQLSVVMSILFMELSSLSVSFSAESPQCHRWHSAFLVWTIRALHIAWVSWYKNGHWRCCSCFWYMEVGSWTKQGGYCLSRKGSAQRN